MNEGQVRGLPPPITDHVLIQLYYGSYEWGRRAKKVDIVCTLYECLSPVGSISLALLEDYDGRGGVDRRRKISTNTRASSTRDTLD